MRLTAIVLVFRDAPFISACLSAIYPLVDRICCVTQYDRNFHGQVTEPDRTLERVLAVQDPEGKIGLLLLRSLHGYAGAEPESQLRNAAMAADPDADYFLIVDADEIHERELLKQAWAQVQAEQPVRGLMPSYTYFKTWNYRISPPDWCAPIVFLRRGYTFKKLRLADRKSGRRWFQTRGASKLLLDQRLAFHHGSYVGDDARIQEKIASWGHAHEVVPNWLETKWRGFSATSTDLHPVKPQIYPGVVRLALGELPPEVKDAMWPEGWLERV